MVCFAAVGAGTDVHDVVFGKIVRVVWYRADAGTDWFWLKGRQVRSQIFM